MAFAPVQPGGIIQANTINNLVSAIDWFSADTGTAASYKVTFDGVTGANKNSITTLTDGLFITFRAVNANTGAATLQVVGPGSVTVGTPPITRNGGTALVAGDIKASQLVVVVYNAANTRFELQNPGTIAAAAVVSGTLPVARGGTGLAAFALGSIPYASAANVLSALPVGAAGRVLGVVGTAPAWVMAPAAHGVELITTNSLSLTNNTLTVNAAWTSASWQTDAGYWASGNQITIPAGLGGKYFVRAVIQFPAIATSCVVSLQLDVNGVTSPLRTSQLTIPASSGGPTILDISTVLNLAATNTLQFRAQQASGGTVALVAAGTALQATLIGL